MRSCSSLRCLRCLLGFAELYQELSMTEALRIDTSISLGCVATGDCICIPAACLIRRRGASRWPAAAPNATQPLSSAVPQTQSTYLSRHLPLSALCLSFSMNEDRINLHAPTCTSRPLTSAVCNPAQGYDPKSQVGASKVQSAAFPSLLRRSEL